MHQAKLLVQLSVHAVRGQCKDSAKIPEAAVLSTLSCSGCSDWRFCCSCAQKWLGAARRVIASRQPWGRKCCRAGRSWTPTAPCEFHWHLLHAQILTDTVSGTQSAAHVQCCFLQTHRTAVSVIDSCHTCCERKIPTLTKLRCAAADATRRWCAHATAACSASAATWMLCATADATPQVQCHPVAALLRRRFSLHFAPLDQVTAVESHIVTELRRRLRVSSCCIHYIQAPAVVQLPRQHQQAQGLRQQPPLRPPQPPPRLLRLKITARPLWLRPGCICMRQPGRPATPTSSRPWFPTQQ